MPNPYPAMIAGERYRLGPYHGHRVGVGVTVQSDSPAGWRHVECLADDGRRTIRLAKETLEPSVPVAPPPLVDASFEANDAALKIVAELRARAATRVAPATQDLLSRAADFIVGAFGLEE